MFLMTINIVDQYQQKHPILTEKFTYATYKRDLFFGGKNTNLNIIALHHLKYIPSKLQIYVVTWYHTYLFHPVLDLIETRITNICTGLTL